MAISTDRVKISEITKRNVSNFQTKLDTPFENFGSMRTTGGGDVFGNKNFFSGLSESINGITGTINETLSGLNNKANSYFKDGISSVLHSDIGSGLNNITNKTMGLFGELKDVNLPNIKTRYDNFVNQNRDIFNTVDKLGNTLKEGKQAYNSVLGSVNKTTSKIDSIFGTNLSGRLNNIINSKTDELLNLVGLNKTDTLMYGIYNNAKKFGSVLGGSASDKTDLLDVLKAIYCDPDAVNYAGGINLGLREAIFNQLLKSMIGDCNRDTSGSFRTLRSIDKVSTAIGFVKTITDDKNSNVLKQANMSIDEYINKEINFEDYLTCKPISVFNSNVGNDEKSLLKGDVKKYFNNIRTIDVNNIENKQETFKNILMTASVVDDNWYKDNEGNINLQYTRCKPMKELSENYLVNKVNNRVNYIVKDDSMNSMVYDMAIVGQFSNEEPIMRV